MTLTQIGVKYSSFNKIKNEFIPLDELAYPSIQTLQINLKLNTPPEKNI